MASENAKMVAKEVLRVVGSGGKPNKTKIAIKYGYSKASARSGKATETKSYKQVMQPLLEKLEKERQRALDELANKDLSQERYSDLVKGIDVITKNIQLLGGKPTEINKIDLSNLSNEELAKLTEESDEGISQEGIGEKEA